MPDLGFARGVITVLTLAAFLGICWWAYRSANRERFEQDAWLAFDDEEPLPPPDESGSADGEVRA